MVESTITRHLANLPLFPLPGTVLFPKMRLPLHIFEAKYRRMVRDAVDQKLPIAMGNLKPEEAPFDGVPAIYPIVGVGVIDKFRELPDGRFLLELIGQARVRVIQENETKLPYRTIQAELVPDVAVEPRAGERAVGTMRSLLVLMRKNAPDVASALAEVVSGRTSPGDLADAIAGILQTDAQLRQSWLEETDPLVRFASVTDLISTLLVQSQPTSGTMN